MTNISQKLPKRNKKKLSQVVILRKLRKDISVDVNKPGGQ